VDVAGITLYPAGNQDQRQRLRAQAALRQLATIVDVGEPAEQRHVPVRETAGDSQFLDLGLLAQLRQHVVVVCPAVELVELTKPRHREQDE